jgi:hypothetical protein
VALVYNPCTQLASPQYHIIFDEGFETVAPTDSAQIEKHINAMFDNLFKENKWIHHDKFIDPSTLLFLI